MYRSLTLTLFLVSLLAFTGSANALVTTHILESPNGDFKIEICVGPIDQTWAHVFYKGKKFLSLNNLGFLLDDGTPIPSVFSSREFTEKMFAERAKAPRLHEGVYLPGRDILKNSIIATPYQESAVGYGGLMKIVFRTYNDGVAFCYEFETKENEPIKIKQELTMFRFNNLHPFRKDRDVPEVLEEFQVSKISDRYASVRIEKIPGCPTLIAGEVPFSGFVPIKLSTKFRQDLLTPTTVKLVQDDGVQIEGTGRPVRSPWRFVKIEQEDEMIEHLDITRNRL